MFENQNDLIQKDIQQNQVAIETETKIDRTAAKEELKDLEISFSFEKIASIKKLLIEVQKNLTRVICLLGGEEKDEFQAENAIKTVSNLNSELLKLSDASEFFSDLSSKERVIEGVFNGQNMVGADGQEYAVPANYASKSKLVEGDILKLIVDPKGNFIYKQIGPIERTRIIGTLIQDGENFAVSYKGRKWRVLTACVTYFKGKPNDEAVILVPKNTPSRWAAVENIIKKGEV